MQTEPPLRFADFGVQSSRSHAARGGSCDRSSEEVATAGDSDDVYSFNGFLPLP